MDAGRKRELEAKVYAGERLSRTDGEALYSSDDLVWLGRLAHHRRTERNGDRVMFGVNRQLHLSDVCSAGCAYCSFHRKAGERKAGESDAYAMGVEEAVRKATELTGEQPTELHLVNGRHPTLPWRYYPDVLRELKTALPDVTLKAFSATDVRWFEKISGWPAAELLDELVDAGLGSLTGGGAEIFDWEVRQHLVDHDCHWADWSRIHRLAHARGLPTPATMLYGHIEEPRHRVDHLLRLRELQDETGGFAAFIPLRYQHDAGDSGGGAIRDRLQERTTMAAPAEALKTFAVSRLLLDNVPHVKSCWVLHGLSVAQLSLNFGADDLDGSAVEYDITADADPSGPMHRADLLNLIWDAGFQPVERDTRYTVVREYDAPPTLAQRRSEPQRIWT